MRAEIVASCACLLAPNKRWPPQARLLLEGPVDWVNRMLQGLAVVPASADFTVELHWHKARSRCVYLTPAVLRGVCVCA